MYFNGTKCCSLIFGCLLSLPVFGKDVPSAKVGSDLNKPVCFVENKGQLADQNNNARNDIQYKLSTPGMTLFVGNGQLHYQFKKVAGKKEAESKVATYRMDVSLLGADKGAMVGATEKQDYYENYYSAKAGEKGITALSYNRIVYKNVYPSIDWVLYVKDNNVEYDFIVHPGGNVNDIKLRYDGTTALKITKDGSLSANTPMGNIVEKTPYAYESSTGRAVASNFKLNKNVVSFETGSYNGSITIDPALSWSTYFGGAGQEVATSLSNYQSPGLNTYVGGYATSPSLATGGVFQTAFGTGTQDGFLAKYNNAGVVQFITYFGGAGSSKATSVALDNGANNVYLAGFTTSPGFGLTSGGAYHPGNNGLTDGFLIKFNSTGARQWCTFYGGLNNDFINGVAVDASNNVYITGQTASATLISTAGAYQTAMSGTADAFLAKFSSTGAIQWSTYFGGSAQEQAFGIVCDNTGKIDITGQTNSVIGVATTGAYQTALSGTNDAFMAQFTAAGVRVWSSYYGGAGTEQGNGIASDAAGNLAIVGNTTSAVGISSANAFQTAYGGVQDAFVTYFTNAGARVWGSYYGGAALDYGQAVCFDANGNPVVAGGAFSSTGIATINSTQPAISGDYDGFIAKITPIGQMLWSTYFGGLFYDFINGIGYDQQGQLAVAGYTTSNGNYGAGGLATTGAAQPANAGGVYDAFTTKFKVDTFVKLVMPYTDTLVCAGGTLQVSYSVFPGTATFQPGNVFSVQLSSATGSFAVPTTIGAAPGTGSGTVNCTVPLIALGTGYRIRVVASNPAFISPDDYVDIHVVPSIGATFATATTPTCVAGTVSFNDTATYTINSYSWTGPGLFTSVIRNPSITGVTIGNAGTYSVTTVHNGCPASTSTVNVVVNSTYPPTPSVGVSAVCAGDTLMLAANSDTTATGITWHWSGPGGFTSTLRNPKIPSATVANSGIYYVTDTLAGCPSALRADTAVVHAIIPVIATIMASPGYISGAAGDTICNGTMVNFTASVYNGGSTPTYQWYAGGLPVVGAITSAWSSSTLADGQNVVCVINSSVLCPSPVHASSNNIKMNVLNNAPMVYIGATPGAHVAPGTSVLFTSAVYHGGTNPKYQWYKNGVAVAGATNTTYIDSAVNAPDSIYLKVISTMDCPIDSIAYSNTVIAESNVGVTHLSASLSGIGLYPNPNSGTFTIKGNLLSSNNLAWEVTNLLGQVVNKGEVMVMSNQLETTIGLGDISSGIYLLHIMQDGQSKIFRFSVERN